MSRTPKRNQKGAADEPQTCERERNDRCKLPGGLALPDRTSRYRQRLPRCSAMNRHHRRLCRHELIEQCDARGFALLAKVERIAVAQSAACRGPTRNRFIDRHDERSVRIGIGVPPAIPGPASKPVVIGGGEERYGEPQCAQNQQGAFPARIAVRSFRHHRGFGDWPATPCEGGASMRGDAAMSIRIPRARVRSQPPVSVLRLLRLVVRVRRVRGFRARVP